MFLMDRELAPKNAKVDATRQMLQEALNYAIFIPFSAGTITQFEHALYSEKLPPDQFNKKWWELVAKYQGVAPPTTRDESYADGLTKTHINDDPGQYYDYALSYALLFQMHDHIARKILKQDPHNTDYYGNKGVGEFLRTLMAPGASRDWRDVLKETTGHDLDAQALVDYFKPLQDWLVEQNVDNALSIVSGDWKYIEPNKGPAVNTLTATELGNDPVPQLYNLASDIGEKHNIAAQHSEKAKELSTLLQSIKDAQINRQ